MPNLVSPGDSAAENDWLQLAGSHKYDSSLICTIAEIAPGVFALYQHANVLYVGEWDGLLEHYRNRPAYIRQARPPRTLVAPKRTGKISAEDKRANTLALLAKLKGSS